MITKSKITVILSVAQQSRSIFSLENLNILFNGASLNKNSNSYLKRFLSRTFFEMTNNLSQNKTQWSKGFLF